MYTVSITWQNIKCHQSNYAIYIHQCNLTTTKPKKNECNNLHQWHLGTSTYIMLHLISIFSIYPCMAYNNLHRWHLSTSTNIILHLITIFNIYPCMACNNLHRWHLSTSTNIILHLLTISMCSLQQPASVTSRYICQHNGASVVDINIWPATTCIDDI